MKTKAISIQIAEPCTQNWEFMEKRDQERFCEACQKCVVDFSNHSNAEIVKIIASSKEGICGRLTATQLNQLNYYLLAVPSNKNWLKYLGVLAIGASLFVNEAKANSFKEPTVVTVNSEKSTTDLKPNKVKKIYGYVFDENNKPMVGVRVVVTNSKLSATTDKNGRYEMSISDTLNPKSNFIKVASFDNSVALNYKTAKQTNLVLYARPIIMGKIAIVRKD